MGDISWYGSKLYKVDEDLILVILNPEGDRHHMLPQAHIHDEVFDVLRATYNLLELRILENLWMTTNH